MSRVAVAIMLALALVQWSAVCDAGVLGFLGEKAEQLKNDTKVVITAAEKGIKGLFGHGDDEAQKNEEPERPAPEPTSGTVTTKAADKGTTTVAPRDFIVGAPRCAGDEEWDSETKSCVPDLG